MPFHHKSGSPEGALKWRVTKISEISSSDTWARSQQYLETPSINRAWKWMSHSPQRSIYIWCVTTHTVCSTKQCGLYCEIWICCQRYCVYYTVTMYTSKLHNVVHTVLPVFTFSQTYLVGHVCCVKYWILNFVYVTSGGCCGIRLRCRSRWW